MSKSSAAVPVLSAVILAGGQSCRMGQDKHKLRLGKQSLLASAIETLGALSNDVIVVTSPNKRLAGLARARVLKDVIAGGGALSGLHAGLSAARHEYALVVACDMPFLNIYLLRYMAVLTQGYDAIVPFWRNEAEPLHAIYSRACLPAIESLLKRSGGRIVDFYPQVNVRYVGPDEIGLFDPQGLSFFNINTPQDWERAQALAAQRESRLT